MFRKYIGIFSFLHTHYFILTLCMMVHNIVADVLKYDRIFILQNLFVFNDNAHFAES